MFGFGVSIPRGKLVNFITGIDSIDETEFLLDSEITIKATSTFKNIADVDSNPLLTAVSGVAKGVFNFNVPVSFKQLGFQQWESTDPLSLSFTVAIHMDKDAYTDVVLPIQALTTIPLPTEIDKNGGLSAPGPSLYDVLFKSNGRKNGVDIYLGALTFRQCILTGVDTTFSTETDVNNYPIWAKANVSATTVFMATDVMIDNMFSANSPQAVKNQYTKSLSKVKHLL
jgi:hypothetical protein